MARDVKTVLTFEKRHIVAELKFKMAKLTLQNKCKHTFDISVIVRGCVFEGSWCMIIGSIPIIMYLAAILNKFA